MIFTFNARKGPVLVLAKVWGFRGYEVFTLILDTGADVTVLNPTLLRAAGLRPQENNKKFRLVMGSGVEFAAAVTVPKFKALGKTRTNYEVASFELEDSTQFDGVLGLDFLRGFDLHINFKTGHIELK